MNLSDDLTNNINNFEIGVTDEFNVKSLLDLVKGKYTSPAQTHEKSSYNPDDLDHLVQRYTYDIYHNTPINNKEWGIEYNYRPHNMVHTVAGLFSNKLAPTLKISSDKYTPEQAEQIARGAGMKTYEYRGKKQNVNLFNVGEGSQYANQKEFETTIANAKATQGLKAAQNLYNTELARQYNNFGIDFLLLNNKSDALWNQRYGGINYGYNTESKIGILKGEQAAGNEYNYLKSFDDTDYDAWYRSYNGIGSKDQEALSRTAIVNLQSGFPLDELESKNQIAFVGARPNANDIDYTNWYQMTNKSRGSRRMKAYLYKDITEGTLLDMIKGNSKDVHAAYQYFNYVLDPKNNKTGKDNNYSEEFLNNADKLADAANLPKYHREENFSPYFTLGSFYKEGFDENGNLKSTFKYSENGYRNNNDSGAYTVFIKDGRFDHAEDTWNISPYDIRTTMSTNNGKGVPLINRNEKWDETGLLNYYSANLQIGGLLRYITKSK